MKICQRIVIFSREEDGSFKYSSQREEREGKQCKTLITVKPREGYALGERRIPNSRLGEIDVSNHGYLLSFTVWYLPEQEEVVLEDLREKIHHTLDNELKRAQALAAAWLSRPTVHKNE